MTENFGNLLKHWRGRRHLSQSELGFNANVSARHVSFLETGRSNPSQSMVLQLSQTLNIPRAVRNTLLKAAGFSPKYQAQNFSQHDMAPIMAAMDWTLDRHDPYPAFTLDRHWKILRTNSSAGFLFKALGIQSGDSLIDAFINQGGAHSPIRNWSEIAHHLILRLQTESHHFGGDVVLNEAIDQLQKTLPPTQSIAPSLLPAIIPMQFASPRGELSLFSTIAHFGLTEDIILADVKIELMFPANEETRQILTTQL